MFRDRSCLLCSTAFFSLPPSEKKACVPFASSQTVEPSIKLSPDGKTTHRRDNFSNSKSVRKLINMTLAMKLIAMHLRACVRAFARLVRGDAGGCLEKHRFSLPCTSELWLDEIRRTVCYKERTI